MSKNKAETEILFGSESRGDTDSLSDKDILIVDDNYERLNARRQQLVSTGFSVAAYTWKRLGKLVDKKSLFIQHLKLEGKVLHDEKGRAASLLNSFCPKSSYHIEIRENEKLFWLLETYPNTRRGMLWVADVLYVSIRNYGVLSLANRGIYSFSYEQIIDELIKSRDFSLSDRSSLVKLRWMKSLYRSDHLVPESEIRKVILSALNAIQKVTIVRPVPVYPLDMLEEIAPTEQACAYERLRRIEKYYLALTAINPVLEDNADFKEILRAIEDPRSYSFLASKEEEKILEIFREAYSQLSATTYVSEKTKKHA